MDLRKILDEKKVLFFNGGMGTEMARRGLGTGGLLSLTAPEHIIDFYRGYVDLGVDCLSTNTFNMNRIYVETHGIDIDLRKVNYTSVKLARETAGSNCFVFGEIGPTGKLLKPYGEYEEEDFINNFREQASFLAEAGVDGFLVETMTDLREALCSLKGCKQEYDLPVIVSMSFHKTEKGGRTIMGASVSEIVETLEQGGVDGVGANCGDLTPLETAQIVALYKKHTQLPIIVQPNAGKPRLQEKQTVYDMTPEEYSQGVLECIEQGAKIVGGCCGTTIDHMTNLIRKVRTG